LFLSGFIPVDPTTRKVNGLDIDSQAEAVMIQIRGAVENAGSDLKHILKLECFLADPSDFAGWNQVFARYFTEEPPARITQVGAFVEEGVRIQVHGVAAIPERRAVRTPGTETLPTT
jgi:2-iminobutanoate/2-iminopropanoate deaminase